MSKHYKNTLAHQKIPLYYIIPLIIAASFVPLILRIYKVDYPLENISWYTEGTIFFDIYSLAKSNIIKFLGALSLASLINLCYKDPKTFIRDKINVLALISIFIIFISTLLSPFPYQATHGYIERFEDAYVNITYFILFLYAYNIKWSESHLKIFFKWFTASNIILGIIGLGQYFGFDILLNDFFISLITSSSLTGIKLDSSSMITYKVISQTLYHYNYVSFFTTLSLPFFLNKTIYEDKLKWRLFYGFTALLTLFNLFGSSARSGMVGLIVAIPFWIFFNRDKLLRNTKVFIIIICSLVAVFIGFEILSGGFVTMRIKSTFETPKQINLIQRVYTNQNDVVILTDNDIVTLKIPPDSTDLTLIDVYVNDILNPIEVMKSSNKIEFTDPNLSLILLELQSFDDGSISYTFTIDSVKYYYMYRDNKLILYNMYGVYEETPNFKSLGFYGYERLGSMRGYIWSRTFPLILEKPLIGYGADTFPMVFPQHDYIGKKYAYTTDNMVIDKAHNYIIQQAFSFGIPFILIILSLWFIYFKRFIAILSKSKFKCLDAYNSYFIIMLIAFIIASMFNDSSVHVSPSYWVLFGIGLSYITSQVKSS